jgi:PfaD family protein
VRVGAAGGIGTPAAAAAAFALGAAYVLTGSVNQACVESGTSDLVRALLAEAGMADVIMAPSSDMFEAGVQVQVLRRGTMFAQRARQLHEVYRTYPALDALPPDVRERVESKVLGRPIDAVWADCVTFFRERDPAQLERARRDPKHHMALVFRWYLGMSSRWAIAGDVSRTTDTQIWCGPAMGAFNDWVRGSFLEAPAERSVVTVAANLTAGAAFHLRLAQLRAQGVEPGPAARWVPRPLARGVRPRVDRGHHVGI